MQHSTLASVDARDGFVDSEARGSLTVQPANRVFPERSESSAVPFGTVPARHVCAEKDVTDLAACSEVAG